MGKLEAEYYYQAKGDIIAQAELTAGSLAEEVFLPLENNDSTIIVLTTSVSDVSGNEVAKVNTTWQIKRWDKVRTRV